MYRNQDVRGAWCLAGKTARLTYAILQNNTVYKMEKQNCTVITHLKFMPHVELPCVDLEASLAQLVVWCNMSFYKQLISWVTELLPASQEQLYFIELVNSLHLTCHSSVC
jgi:hypothetical protein